MCDLDPFSKIRSHFIANHDEYANGFAKGVLLYREMYITQLVVDLNVTLICCDNITFPITTLLYDQFVAYVSINM